MRNPSRQAVAWALALPTLLLLLVFFFYPLLRIAGMSVGFPQLSLADYATVFNPVNRLIAVRTFAIAAGITLVTLLLAYPMAAFLCRAQGMARKLAMLCVVIPFLTSFLVRSYAWVVLLGDEGAINSALRWLGLEVRRHVVLDADHATVEFVARSQLNGRASRLHETSRFVREDGRWYYVDGDIRR